MIDFNLNTIDWVAISSLLTFAMVIITVCTLWQNNKQLKEIKRQWSEQNRARLNISIVAKNNIFALKISNVGKSTAYGIDIKISQNFIDCLYSDYVKNTFEKLNNKKYILEAGNDKYIYISPVYGQSSHTINNSENYSGEEINKWLDSNKNTPISITGVYCDLYKIDETFCIDDFIINSIIVNDALTVAIQNIKEGTVVQNNNYMPIQKSLDMIAKNIDKLKIELNNGSK